MDETSCRAWAVEEFKSAQLGDERRSARLVAMATEVAKYPGGRVSSVFRRSADRQGAYDFLESKHVDAKAMLAASVEAACVRAAAHPFVFVPLDGTSLNLTDHARSKDFGSVGSRERGARGLKVVDAIMVSPSGVPLGLAAMQWWTRGARPTQRLRQRTTEDKEQQHWHDAVDAVTEAIERHAPTTRAWFQLDREGDAQDLLAKLVSSRHLFTVRSQSNRRLSTTGVTLPGARRHKMERRRYLRPYMSRRPVLGDHLLELPARAGQPARTTCVVVRAAAVVLQLHDRRTSRHRAVPMNVVWVREHGRGRRTTTRSGKTPVRAIEWMLLTNHPVATLEDALKVIDGYTQRWRIEDFHRAWKRGVCNVEDSQLRARDHVIKWATVLAAVAVRAERLKHLAREKPKAPASSELTVDEIEALTLLKRRYAKSNEVVAETAPDLETAVRWIAELGGYIGRRSGGPPGSVTIARGLAQLQVAADLVAALRRPPRSD